MDDALKSDGDIIKFQVKSVYSLSEKNKSIYVSENHIKYWKNFSAPIIICCVDQESEIVYWQPIYQTELYLTDGNSRKIVFSRENQKLDAESKQTFRSMVMPQEAKDFTNLLKRLSDYIKNWEGVNAIDGSDDSYLQKIEGEASEIEALVKRLYEERSRFPWRFSPIDVKIMEFSRLRARWVDQTSRRASVEHGYN